MYDRFYGFAQEVRRALLCDSIADFAFIAMVYGVPARRAVLNLVSRAVV